MMLGIQNEESHPAIDLVIHLAEVGRLLKLVGESNEGVIV